ncbi:MAG: RNA polymerase sigma factor [Myxococcaceae bacterium]
MSSKRDSERMFATTTALDLPLSDTHRMTFEACYQAHRNRVYALGLRYGRGRETWAEDLAQDVFMKLLKELPQLEEHEDLGGWIYRVATNAALSRLRRERSVLHNVHRLFANGEEIEEAPQDRVEMSENAREAEKLLQTLPPKERVALSMKVLDGRSQREIAELLGHSEGYVSKLLARAWEHIRAAGWEMDDGQA